MKTTTWTQGDFLISTDKRKLQVSVIQRFLANESYWAAGISLEKVRITIRHSTCFGMYLGKKQIGYCRVVTDFVRFAWLADVFILPEFRGRGLSKWLMQIVLGHPDFQDIRRWTLGTKDAHGLYTQFGFSVVTHGRIMEKDGPGL